LMKSSALQRAENSSIQQTPVEGYVIPAFQCSSASRKFLNRAAYDIEAAISLPFQCSSASRKFLNPARQELDAEFLDEFQCSSASRKFLNPDEPHQPAFRVGDVSVLFSEPKIPQS